MKFCRFASLTFLILTLGACKVDAGDEAEVGADETGTGNGDGDGDQDSELGGACGTVTIVDLEDIFQTPEGFDTPINELLAPLEGNFAGTFTWAAADGPWTVSHAGTSSPLTAALAYSGGAVRLAMVEKAGMPPDGELGGVELCANYVVVDVILEFATEDGVFAESWDVQLSLSAGETEAAASVYQSLDLDTMSGTLSADDFVLADGVLTDLVLLADLGEAGLTGSLAMEVTVGEGDEGIVGFGAIAGYDAPRVP